MTETETDNARKNNNNDIPIKGRFDQYRSSYWAAAVAVLGLRYAPRPFFRKSWDNPRSHFDKHKYAGFAGLVMEGVTGFYALRTSDDMKSIFAKAVAWEMDKDPKDVTFSDLSKSQNTIVKQTVENYWRYNIRRSLVNATFFLPFILQPFFKTKPWFKGMHAETGVDLGMGMNAAYLFSDVISRKITPFEEIQALIDHKINQSDHFAEKFVANDLLDVYERHAVKGAVHSFISKRGTQAWPEVEQLFERMADLINQTHKNTVPHEHANFDFSKFIYLVGNGLIDPDHMEQSKAYVELANQRSIADVKKFQQQLIAGELLPKLVQEYGIAALSEEKKPTEASPEPATIILSPVSIQKKAQENISSLPDKAAAGLAFQERLHQQKAMPAEGLAT